MLGLFKVLSGHSIYRLSFKISCPASCLPQLLMLPYITATLNHWHQLYLKNVPGIGLLSEIWIRSSPFTESYQTGKYSGSFLEMLLFGDLQSPMSLLVAARLLIFIASMVFEAACFQSHCRAREKQIRIEQVKTQ